ncbi:WhiB family transcriptional regulator [Dactylosporangium sucinum]|uniref:4Fe-4S Wbl-type domain-containing protein n=1 Tax=Dactylosporangium sucinum TaxID=1424081 RepID=A0A917X1P3_9ACTN|nr:WhiB family transcriptional regulator [Dactylosporangium sucinum]GGM53670.1 hypothetical protein GCM10007977_064070 [Dactylosporangium sucinum]
MNQEWRLHAACRGTDPAMWDSPTYRSGADTRREVAAARVAMAYCATCPVWADCDDGALRRPPVGVIRAGRAYDGEGQPSKDCERCGEPILTRNRASARFCSVNCKNLTHYHAAQRERIAA